MINCFSKEVCDEIGYYVYRLIDPRDGSTFYVGKGKRNRLFAHMNAALENFNEESYLEEEENDENLKLSRIRDIERAGLHVIHIIQRWGLTETEAFLLEGTLIDLYGLEHLSNRVRGFDTDHGVCNAETLERDLHCEYYEDKEENPSYIIIKVQNWRLNQVNNDRYYATRHCWKIANWRTNPKRYPYVLSVTGGIVREVYKVDSWNICDNGRKEFIGKVAEKEIRDLFLNKRIPDYYSKKGMASPVLFSKN